MEIPYVDRLDARKLLDFSLFKTSFEFGDHWAQCDVFENGVLLMYTLEGVSCVANFITAYEDSQ